MESKDECPQHSFGSNQNQANCRVDAYPPHTTSTTTNPVDRGTILAQLRRPCHPPAKPRNPRQGVTTLAALAGILLLAVLPLTLQTRTAADFRLFARLTDDLETRAAKDSLTDRLRTPPLAAALTKDPGVIFKLQYSA